MDCGIIQRISPQEARDRHLFGPVYHGTTPDRIEQIRAEGFRFERGGRARSGFTRHGMTLSHPLVGLLTDQEADYALGYPAPIHWLGYGVYFTTSRKSATQYGVGSTRDIGPWYLDAPNIETINFAAPHKMMKWWPTHGFDGELAKLDRVAATERMTDYLAAEYDAVYFKGRGYMGRALLDGDQVCVYDPERIYCLDKSLASEMEIGSKIVANEQLWGPNTGHWEEGGYVGNYRTVTVPPGTRGVITNIRPFTPDIHEMRESRFHDEFWHEGDDRFLEIKWSPRGRDLNVYPSQVLPAPPRGRK